VLRHFAAFRLRPLSSQLSTDPLGPFLVRAYSCGFRFHGFRQQLGAKTLHFAPWRFPPFQSSSLACTGTPIALETVTMKMFDPRSVVAGAGVELLCLNALAGFVVKPAILASSIIFNSQTSVYSGRSGR
jgi:hypothetical protein